GEDATWSEGAGYQTSFAPHTTGRIVALRTNWRPAICTAAAPTFGSSYRYRAGFMGVKTS
ncbi:MAG: hypothetical protein ACTHW1_02600, partial [Ancrocorticia sp.]|uniref:hypothetical protein n=1 Tax=Ancrocorticia sp. TaxID=2593684 RepID=UPI003F932B28